MTTIRSDVFLEAVFWVFGEGAAFFHGGHRLWGFGEGLGGGYRTPPNRKRCERSELIFGGSGGLERSFAASGQTVSRVPALIVVTI